MIPTITLENLKISKYICGTNNFVGINHRLDFIYAPYYYLKFRKIERITEILGYLVEQGVNAIISSPRVRIYEAIQSVQQESSMKIHWICSPSTRKTVKSLEMDIHKQIDWCADHEVSVCMPHRDYTDFSLDTDTMTIKGLEPILEHIRDKKMVPGLSCHFHKVVEAVEKQEYDVKLIVQPYNQIGFESDIDPFTLGKIIQKTKISILNIKPLAAGRLDPKLALPYCLKSIKKNDLIAVGTPKLSHAKEIVSIFNKFYST
jgi:hypothetical protein